MYHPQVKVPGFSTQPSRYQHSLGVATRLGSEVPEHTAVSLKHLDTGAISMRLNDDMGVKCLQEETWQSVSGASGSVMQGNGL